MLYPGLDIPNIIDQVKTTGTISALRLMDIVAFGTGIRIEEIKDKCRKREIKEARQLFHYFAKKYTTLSFATIASYTNNDHATVLNSIKVVNNLKETESVYMGKFQKLKNMIKAEINKVNLA